MKKNIVYISILLMTGISVLTGCKKDKTTDEPLDTDFQSAKDNSLAEGTFNDVNNIANQAMQNDSLTYYRFGNDLNNMLSSSCATVTRYDTSGRGSIVVFFGNDPCLCRDNRYRKGTIEFHYSGAYRDSGTVINLSFDNYYVGSDSSNIYKVEGNKSVVNKGPNAAGHTVFDIYVNGSLRNNAGQTLTWISTRHREWIGGESTPGIWLDDEYRITGSAQGTGFNGSSFSLTITHGLHVALNCRWIKAGKFDFIPGALATRHFDYGAGFCDPYATVTINGVSYSIVLP